MARRRRTLSPEEQRLWEHVARHVTPLGDRKERPAPPETSVAHPVTPAPTAPVSLDAGRKPPPGPARNAKPKVPFLPPYIPPRSQPGEVAATIGGLERRERVALRRGSRQVDAVLDLHGMRQAEAQGALVRFLQRARAMDHAIVLVVTGKGGYGLDGGTGPYGLGDERGVLRRMVPHWLRSPDLRPFVVGFEQAAQHAGGAGALYVRLRRRR